MFDPGRDAAMRAAESSRRMAEQARQSAMRASENSRRMAEQARQTAMRAAENGRRMAEQARQNAMASARRAQRTTTRNVQRSDEATTSPRSLGQGVASAIGSILLNVLGVALLFVFLFVLYAFLRKLH